MTSPETGSLFGVLVARFLDRWWRQLGEPDPFLVVEAGAGRGRLAREVLRAEPSCTRALRYVLVERSPVLRAAQRELLVLEPWEDALGPFARGEGFDAPGGEVVAVGGKGPIVTALDTLPSVPIEGVVLANEMLDNLPFDVVERGDTGWREIRVGLDAAGRFAEIAVPAAPERTPLVDAPSGTRLPIPHGMEAWLTECAAGLRRGVLVVIDYTATDAELVARGPSGWLRTYRAHARGADPLDAPGSQDITHDVPIDALRHAARQLGLVVVAETTQAEWLRGLGLDELVEAARTRWRERAATDLDALAARSWVTEATALTDLAGLGAHTVLVLAKSLP